MGSQLETATSGNKQRSTRNGLCSTTVESKTINSFGTKAVISSSLTNPPAPVNPAFNLQNNKIVDESGLFKKKKRLSDDTLCSENICLTNSSDKVPFTPAPNTIPASGQTAVSSGTTLFTPSSTLLSTPVVPFASLPTAPVAPIQSESNFTAPAFSFGSKHISENATIGAIPLATNSIPKKNSFNFTATSSSTLTHVNEKENPAFSFGSSSTPAAGVSAASTFSFGSSTASQANAPVSVPNVGFSFGAQSKNNTVGAPNFNYSSSSKSTPVTSVFAFGAPVQETQAQPVSAFPNNGFGSGSLGSVPNSIAPSSLGGFNATSVPTPGPANSFTPNTGAVSNGGFSIGTGGGKTRGRRIVRGKRR